MCSRLKKVVQDTIFCSMSGRRRGTAQGTAHKYPLASNSCGQPQIWSSPCNSSGRIAKAIRTVPTRALGISWYFLWILTASYDHCVHKLSNATPNCKRTAVGLDLHVDFPASGFLQNRPWIEAPCKDQNVPRYNLDVVGHDVDSSTFKRTGKSIESMHLLFEFACHGHRAPLPTLRCMCSSFPATSSHHKSQLVPEVGACSSPAACG